MKAPSKPPPPPTPTPMPPPTPPPMPQTPPPTQPPPPAPSVDYNPQTVHSTSILNLAQESCVSFMSLFLITLLETSGRLSFKIHDIKNKMADDDNFIAS